MTTLREKIASLPRDMQDEIEKGTAELIAEEMDLRALRKALGLTQDQLARTLGIKQAGLSALEKRTDLFLSTLRNLITAMGGRLSLVAEFPDHAPVIIKGLAPLEVDETAAETSRHRRELACTD